MRIKETTSPSPLLRKARASHSRMSERLLKKAEEVHLELVEALGRVCSELSSPRNEGERWREDHGTADGCSRHCESLRAAINEVYTIDIRVL